MGISSERERRGGDRKGCGGQLGVNHAKSLQLGMGHERSCGKPARLWLGVQLWPVLGARRMHIITTAGSGHEPATGETATSAGGTASSFVAPLAIVLVKWDSIKGGIPPRRSVLLPF